MNKYSEISVTFKSWDSTRSIDEFRIAHVSSDGTGAHWYLEEALEERDVPLATFFLKHFSPGALLRLPHDHEDSLVLLDSISALEEPLVVSPHITLCGDDNNNDTISILKKLSLKKLETSYAVDTSQDVLNTLRDTILETSSDTLEVVDVSYPGSQSGAVASFACDIIRGCPGLTEVNLAYRALDHEEIMNKECPYLNTGYMSSEEALAVLSSTLGDDCHVSRILLKAECSMELITQFLRFLLRGISAEAVLEELKDPRYLSTPHLDKHLPDCYDNKLVYLIGYRPKGIPADPADVIYSAVSSYARVVSFHEDGSFNSTIQPIVVTWDDLLRMYGNEL